LRLVDESVFVHAFLKPKRELKPHEVKIKEFAKEIVKRINDGEEVGITVEQIAEIANILQAIYPSGGSQGRGVSFISWKREGFDVMKKDCLKALEIVKDKDVGFSDATAYVIMKKGGIGDLLVR